MSGDETLLFDNAFRHRVLEVLRARCRVGTYTRQDLAFLARTDWDGTVQRIALDVEFALLGEQLPTEVVETLHSKTVEFRHFASWWDHVKAAYRHRWWMRWRHWPVAYHTEVRTLTGRVVVNLERWHVFPAATTSGDTVGQPGRVLIPGPALISWSEATATSATHPAPTMRRRMHADDL